MHLDRAAVTQLAVAAVGSALGLALFTAVWAYERHRTTAEFLLAAEEVLALVERRSRRAFDVLTALDGLASVAGGVPREGFRTFAEPFLDDSLYALGWAPAADGPNADRVRELVPLYAVEPADAFWQGMDLNQDPEFRELLRRARAQRSVAATAPEPEGVDGAPYPMAVLLKPVGGEGSAPLGYVLVAVRLDTLARASLASAREPPLVITLRGARGTGGPVRVPPVQRASPARTLSLAREIPFADRPWHVEVAPLPGAYGRGPGTLAFACVLLALVAVGALTAYVRQRERGAARVRELAQRLHEEVDERRRAEQQLHELAHHDPLTGLPNRRLFEEHVNLALAHAKRADEGIALLYIDLDGFKEVNDELGHEHGDLLLREIALRLAAAVRAEDRAARLGGDEFAVLLPGVEAVGDAVRVAEKIRTCVCEPVTLCGKPRAVTTSIGISRYPADAHTLEQLLRHADEAMYCAKRSGKNGYCVWGVGRLDADTRLTE